jgi:TetR/AcrR family transcriptional regulator, tetracycline repressor protein
MALDRQQIVDEAVALLDAEGLDGVTTRKLATRLGVQSPTLYWHVPNKAALVTAIADELLRGVHKSTTPPAPDEPWQDWLASLARRLRRALIEHPDGARVVSTAQLSAIMAAISETAMSALVSRDVPLREARVIVLTVERFTIGHVLEEQAPRPAAEGFDLETFAQSHPTLVAGITDYFQDGATVDDLFDDCLDVVIAGAVATARRDR